MGKYQFKIFVILLFIWGLSSIGDSLFYWSNDDIEVIGGPFHNISTFSLIAIEILALFNFLDTKRVINNDLSNSIYIWLIYATIITIITSNELFFDIRRLVWWVAIYYLSYKLSLTNTRFTANFINKIFPMLFIGICVIFVLIRLRNMIALSGDLVTSNDVFYISLAVPLLLLIEIPKLRYTLFIISFLLVLSSFKRSAIISSCLCAGIVIFNLLKRGNMSNTKKIMILTILSILLFGGFVYVDNKTDGHLTNRFNDIEESGGSGRTYIWESLIEKYKESPSYKQAFGIGFNQMKFQYQVANSKDGRLYSAHNDYLEMLVDYGWIGLILYLVIQKNYFKLIQRSKRYSLQNEYVAAFSSFAIFTIMCLFSHMFIYPSFHAFLMAALGIINGKLDRIKMNNNQLYVHRCFNK